MRIVETGKLVNGGSLDDREKKLLGVEGGGLFFELVEDFGDEKGGRIAPPARVV